MNIIAVDQEVRGLAVVTNGKRSQINSFDELSLPPGGGVIVADSNVWSVNNGLSQSQYCFDSLKSRDEMLQKFADSGYQSLSVSTKYARILYLRRNRTQADAVEALYDEVAEQINENGRFSSGKPVRETRGDVSQGMREKVSMDFLRMQNSGGYESDFLKNGIEIAWNALDKRGKQLFNLKITRPEATSPNRVSSVLVCTHDPATGERREYNGKPWGMRFITHRILCLNGLMQGTGALSPGTPMRAVLRILGRRRGDKVNVEERRELDRYVRVLIRAFQGHEVI